MGDRSNHAMVLHFAQIGYFTLFGVSYLAILHRPAACINALCDLASSVLRKPILSLMIFSGCVALLWYGSPIHPFILADNRHYTFYIWKAFFRRFRLAKLVMLPVYVAAAWLIGRALRRRSGDAALATSPPVSSLWLLGYLLALCLALVPAHLVEPRYFLVPFLVLHVHAEPMPAGHTWLLVLASILANILTIGIFLFRPFVWPDGSIARFMW